MKQYYGIGGLVAISRLKKNQQYSTNIPDSQTQWQPVAPSLSGVFLLKSFSAAHFFAVLADNQTCLGWHLSSVSTSQFLPLAGPSCSSRNHHSENPTEEGKLKNVQQSALETAMDIMRNEMLWQTVNDKLGFLTQFYILFTALHILKLINGHWQRQNFDKISWCFQKMWNIIFIM